MRSIILTFALASFFVQQPAFADSETKSLKNIIALQKAQLDRLEASLKATNDRIKTLEENNKTLETKNKAHSENFTTLSNSISAIGNKWSGLDIEALKRVTAVAGGVRLNAAPFIYDFRENGLIWVWKDGQPVESLTINATYENPQICQAYGRNCVKFH